MNVSTDNTLSSYPTLIAHRGARAVAPENTLASFQKALALGARWIEFDIQRTVDNHLVVLHDATLQRTTSGTGYVYSQLWDEIRLLDNGSWFDAEFHNERIPLLSQVMTAVPKDIHLDIEVKPQAASATHAYLLAEKLLDVLHRSSRIPTAIVTSFSMHALEAIRSLDSNVQLGVLHHGRPRVKTVVNQLERINAVWYLQNVLTITKSLVQRLRENGIQSGVFTANSPRTLHHALLCGVDFVVTDDLTFAQNYYTGMTSPA